MTIISKEAVLCKAEEEAKGMSEPYNYEFAPLVHWILDKIPSVEPESKWIPVSERLPEVNEEAYSNDVLISLRKTTWDIYKCQIVHITKIAYYNENAISSDGRYMDTEGWVLEDGSALSMDEVIAWMPLPKRYEEEKNEVSN